MICALVNVALCDYRTWYLQAELSLKVMPLRRDQARRKKLADEVDLLVVQIVIDTSMENDQIVCHFILLHSNVILCIYLILFYFRSIFVALL